MVLSNINSEKILFLLILKILISFEAEPVFLNTNPKNYFLIEKSLDSSKRLLIEIMHGQLPFKLETPSKIAYNLDFILKINGNFPFPYTLKSLDMDPENNGIFIGAGINLLIFSPEEIDRILMMTFIPWMERDRIKKLCGLSGIEAIEKVKNENIMFNIEHINMFNKAAIDYIVENKLINEFSRAPKYLKTTFINGLLSAYIQFPTINEDLKKSLINNNYTSNSYIIQHSFEAAPFARFIQSKLILMMDGNLRFNNNHLFFVVPMIFEENEKNHIKELITSFSKYQSKSYHINKVRISVLIYGSNKKAYLINYDSNKDTRDKKEEQLNDLFDFSGNKTEYINFTELYENVLNLFEENKKDDVFENKLVTLFLNYNIGKLYFNEINIIIDKYKKKGVQTIPIINKDDSIKYFDVIHYNIFFDFSKAINVGPLNMAASNMHIYIDLIGGNKNINIFKKIENLRLSDVDAPLYIEVHINKEKNESLYYEISLEINKTSGYNIFVSDENPYPNIKDYTIKFIKYDDNLNPKLRLKASSLDQFYISIEGIIYCNLTIERKYNKEINKLIESEGDYKKRPYNISIYLSDDTKKYLESYTFNYRPKSKLFKNNFPLDSILKYFTRGIDLSNTDDSDFFNYDLFIYLFSNSYLINTVYRSSENNNYYIGRFIELNQLSPYQLREEGFTRLLINKLYPFINGNNNTLNDTDIPAVNFNEDELRLIYNITNTKYISKITNLLNRTSNTKNFKDLTRETKFALFCLYFQNSKEHLENIKNLAHREPKYPEVLKSLKSLKPKDKDNEDILNKFMISFISNFEQQVKFEKILITVVVGQSFILTETGVKFIEAFYNSMIKAKAKISLLVYDTLKSENKIKTIIPFYSKKLTRIEVVNEYKEKNYNKIKKYNYTDQQNMDFDKIINFGLSYFHKYDTGIKKEIFIVTDENFHTKHKYYINNKLTHLNYNKHKQLRSNQIKVIVISTKNAEKGDIPELFTLETKSNVIKPFTISENYFHVNNYQNINFYMEDLCRMAKDAIIKLNLGTRFINDFYHGKLNYYEINCEDFKTDIIVIKANLSNFNFYYSFDNPFPNQYIDMKADKKADNDKIIISELKKDKIYLGIESKDDIKKQIFEIFSCESYYSKKQYKNCKFVESHKYLWYLLILIVAIFIIGLAVYYLGHSNKNKMNIFE